MKEPTIKTAYREWFNGLLWAEELTMQGLDKDLVEQESLLHSDKFQEGARYYFEFREENAIC